MCGRYDAVTTVAESFAGAALGLGVAEACDGEIVSVDGQTWRIPDTGMAEVASADLGLAFAVAAWSGEPVIAQLNEPTSFAQLAHLVGSIIGAEGAPVAAVRVDGTFTNVLLRSESRQHKPYPPLDEVLAQEVRFTFAHWEGTLVGFHFPASDDATYIPSLHVHGISADRNSGGHCHDATVQRGELRVWLDDVRIGSMHASSP